MTKLSPTAYRTPLSGKPAQQLILLLHGWGADGYNLIDLAEMFAPSLPNAYFIAPNAPFVCEANPYGFQWFSLIDRTPSHLLEGIRRASDILNKFIDEQLEATGAKELALVGFSQGTMSALHTALRRTPSVDAVVGFSGALIAPEILAAEIKSRPPVCLIHGEADDVVPYASMANAEATLKENKVSVEIHTRPFLTHSIDMEGIEIAKNFLLSKF